ncbi:helix-turn-helix domain-containing protein [Clostridium felsineum]|uniref:Uncharacterized protein n=1 Tax=Clostridium felsineum TaxID=36839 RepID=A0A1S8LPI5_9CLOT|nr:helix-turn-helix transcriptional regulator [Clostridium felsineum]MCR3760134.1 transcriptional regulator [Clostridium felsineum]URZ01319.1 hypothetical protein CLAUR_013090 [Clostridium felsineum]URZ05845.1 hypothetical protein CLROS_011760 [Clostridium felsineum]URZ10882.1 hypothetical protein CROST_015970 [Clostridium felsineum]URZ15622.1 hypothetical protein CLFE_016670 [Clostridium felsineum DSM 794]
MESYEILPIGVKLKRLREKYKLNQDSLAGNDITRNLISQIEHGKANLTRHAAEVMLKNLEKICTKKNIKIEEDIDYLIEDEVSQADKVLEKYIKELQDLIVYRDISFIDKLNEVEAFLVNWDIKDKKIAIFELAGDYFCSMNDFYKSSIYYEKARSLINIDMPTDNVVPIFRKLSMVYFYMGQYDYGAKCCEVALERFYDMDDKYTCIFLFNSSLCYIKLEEYYKALKKLCTLEKVIKKVNEKKYYEVLLQKAACFEALKNYGRSLDICNEILSVIDEKANEQYLMILINLAQLYIKLSEKEKAREILKSTLKNLANISKEFKLLPNMYFEIAKVYRELSDLEKAEEHYLKALKYSKKYSYYFLIDDILLDLIDMYAKQNENSKMADVKNEFFILSSKKDKINFKIMFKLIRFYLDKRDINSLEDIYEFSAKLI